MGDKPEQRVLLTATFLVGGGVFLLGVPLHYFFEAVGRVPVAGFIGPVNESTWEHFKLFYWPLVLLGLIEFPVVRKFSSSYFLPKFFSLVTAFAAMTAFYYIPKAIFGESLFISITAFAVGVITAQIVFFVLASRWVVKEHFEILGFGLIVTLGLLFGLWTFMPPSLFPWFDVRGGFYGIP